MIFQREQIRVEGYDHIPIGKSASDVRIHYGAI